MNCFVVDRPTNGLTRPNLLVAENSLTNASCIDAKLSVYGFNMRTFDNV
jgi:hypothetical protein